MFPLRSNLQRLLHVALAVSIAACAVQRAITAEPATVDAAAFGIRSGDSSDSTPGVRAALQQCLREKARKLVFSPGRYDFWPDRAEERYLFVSNNDEGLKRIAFPLAGFENFEIDGNGAEFVLHGFIAPFLIDHSHSITVGNLSIDYTRTFHSEATVLGCDAEGADVEFPEAFPFEVRNGSLVFTDGKQERLPQTTVNSGEILYPSGNLLEFDAKKRETAFMAHDYYLGVGIPARSIGARRVRVIIPKLQATPGNILVFGATRRDIPGFTLSDSADVKLQNVAIYHCGGMGVVAQRSRNIELNKVRVTPKPGSGRVVSVTADATHFVNCTGRIQMVDCLFENQTDDATNVHGIYARIARRVGPAEIDVQLVHPQQHGFDFIEPGVRLELVHGPSMMTYGEALVKSAERLNKQFTRVVLEKPLPEDFQPGDVVARADANTAEVVIRRCTIRSNRARGILLGSRGKILVENNTFHTPGAAILLEGDARFWYEQAGVRDLTIRNNRFENCNFGVWGRACIEVGAGIEKSCRAQSRYNRNVVIENNEFIRFQSGGLVLAYSVDGLVFRGNRISHTAEYPSSGANSNLFEIANCDNVSVEPPSATLTTGNR